MMRNSMRLVLFLFIYAAHSVGVPLLAQHTKFKDLFPTFSTLSSEEIKTSLKEYIAEDLDHPSANFRLARIYETNYKMADPLTRFEYAIANAEQARLRYIKAKQVVDDREVDRNNEYYFPVFKTYDAKGKPLVTFPQVQQKMNNGYDSADLYIKKVPPIYKVFTSSVSHYDKAVKLFAGISSQFGSTEELVLLYDLVLDSRMGELKMHFDSTTYYLNEYSRLISEYPIRGYNQKYSIQPIKTFHLDGLQSRINFLTNNILLWDYATWVTEIKSKANKDIADLRLRIKQQEEKLNQSLQKAAAIGPGELFKPVILEKQLMFSLGNADRQSLVQHLFHYKAYKQEFLQERKQIQIDTISIARNAQIYTQLIYSNLKADTLLNEVKLSVSPLRIDKHKEFIESYYRGTSGIQTMLNDENALLKTDYKNHTSSIQSAINDLQKEYAGQEGKFIKAGSLSIPLFIVAGDSLPTDNALHTMRLLKNPDGSLYAGGVYRPDKKVNNLVVYISKVAADGRSEWLKSFNLKADSLSKDQFDNFLGPMVLTKEGCAFIVQTRDAINIRKVNTLIYLSEKGDEKKRTKLNDLSYPRYLVYNEVLNGFVVVLKGADKSTDFSVKENMMLLCYNVLGDLLWKREFPLTGNVIKLINLSDGYGVIGNYLWMVDHTGQEFRTKANLNEASPYYIKVKNSGEIALVKPYNFNTSLMTGAVVKINDNSIHLKAQKGTAGSSGSPEDLTSHIMINSQGRVIFSQIQ